MNVENLTTLGLIALMVVGFYFLIIRPTRNRQKEQAKTLESATPGVWVMTTTGIVGRIHRTGDRQVMLEIAPDVYMTVVRQAIMQVLPADQANEFLDPDTMLERAPELDDVDDEEWTTAELDPADAENADPADDSTTDTREPDTRETDTRETDDRDPAGSDPVDPDSVEAGAAGTEDANDKPTGR